MLQEYRDILDHITQATRAHHQAHRAQAGQFPLGCRVGVLVQGDQRIEACRCVATPAWWDRNGVPRFARHHPSLAPNIYAEEVALLLIACQCCLERFLVQLDAGVRDRSLATHVNSGVINFGDPPRHSGCDAGISMVAADLQVVEFWSRRNQGNQGWHRVPGLERTLPAMLEYPAAAVSYAEVAGAEPAPESEVSP